jgi:signal transduction histidine kinase
VTRRFPRDQLFNDLREPLRRVLERLFPLLPRIDDAWRASLGSLVRRRQECRAVAGLSLRRFHPLLAAGDFEGFAAEMEHQGQALAARGVAEEHAFLALALYLEHALVALAEGGPAAPELSAAVARLFSVAQLYLQAGYANAHAADRQALEEQYRLRLGRDLHDEIGHNLIVLKMYMEQMADDFARARAAPARERLRGMRALVADAIDSVRRVILDLGPAVLDQQGLEQAVRLYAGQFSARTGIQVEVRGGALPARLPASHQRALYRVLQGALSNVLEHARASHVRVALEAGPGLELVMSVEDDGVGFNAGRRAPPPSFGFKTMRERMAALGGQFRVESPPAGRGRARRGTRVEVKLPLPGKGHDHQGPAAAVRRPSPLPRRDQGGAAGAARAGRGGRGGGRPGRA